MSTPPHDKDLLFGVISMQLGLASEEEVSGFAETWLRDPTRTLADHMERGGALAPEQRKMVEAIVDRAISVNEDNVDKTLSALRVDKEVAERLVGRGSSSSSGALDEDMEGLSFEHVGRYRGGDPAHTLPEGRRGAALVPTVSRPREIGRGGIGRVLIAYDAHLGREIAVKELLPHLVQNDSKARSTDSKAILGRFLREARITAQLEHPNIVPVYELGKRKDGGLYYTMKLVRGRTLSDALKQTHDLADRLKLLNHFVDLCQAIAYAHSRGVVHRDIKPQNVMVGEFGETMVLDWGLAKIRGKRDLRGQDLLREIKQLTEGDVVSTLPGSAFGTPSYMSPEQAEGQIDEIDERSDVWGLGVVLYEILTGRVPFYGPHPFAVVAQVMKEQPAPVLSVYPEAPPELAAVADRALRRDRSERYQTAKELAEEIVAFQTGGRVEAHQYTSWELLKRFLEEQKQKLAVAFVAFVCLLAVAFGAYVQVIGERDRAVRAEADSKKNLAEALTERARTSILARDFMAAEVYSGEALTFGERAETRGLIVALAGVYRPQLVWQTVTWAACHRVAVAPDGSSIACATTDEVALFPKDGGGEAGRHLRAPGGFTLSVVFSPDGKYLAAGSEDGKLRIFELSGDTLVREIPIGRAVHALAYSADGARLAVAGEEKKIRIFETANFEERAPIVFAAGDPIAAVAFSPDGKIIAAGGKSDLVHVFDTSTGADRGGFLAHEKDVTALAFSPDGKLLVSGSRDRTARAFDLGEGRETGVFGGHEDEISALAFSADGRFVFTGSIDKMVRIWGRTSFRTVAKIDGDDPVVALAASLDGSTLAISGESRTLRVFQIGEAAPPPPLRTQSSPVNRISISPDGASIATAADDGIIRVYESANGKKARLFKGHTGGVNSLFFSPNGDLLASGGVDRKLRVWMAQEGREFAVFDVPAHIRAVGFLADGKSLVAATDDGKLRFFGEGEKREVDIEAGTALLMAHHPGCGQILVATESKKVFLVHVYDRKITGELPVQPDRINALSLSPRCDVAAIASGENVALYSLENKLLLGRLPKSEGQILATAFSPDGARIAWGGKDKLVHIASASTHAELAVLDAHAAEVTALDWSKDGELLTSGSEDKTLRLWNLETMHATGPELLARARKDFGMRLVAGKLAFERRARRE